MPGIGSEVLVMPSMGENVAVPLGNVNVGDSVILYQLKDNTRIAVPTLSLSVDSYVFNTPSFQFAGFNWSVDFNFQLIPLLLFLTWKHKDVKWVSGTTVYGDDTNPRYCLRVTSDPRHGIIEYNFGDITVESNADDGAICIGKGTNYGYEIWIMAPRNPDYGSDSVQSFYLFNKLIWSGIIPPGSSLNTIFYHVDNWKP